jgi:RNA polymerase sigma-70 factor (ECF subfamily)
MDAAPEHEADLALARACAAGERAAQAEVERLLRERVRPIVARTLRDAGAVDDVMQEVRARLLLPDIAGRTRLSDYAGQGPLLAWLRAAAARVALNAERQVRREVSDDDALQAAAASGNLEAEVFRGRHRGEFERAFAQALADLTPRQRTLLNLHFAEGLGLEAIGRMYGAHKSTVSRWLAAARAELLGGVRSRLRDRLGLEESAVRSLVRALRSRVDLGLSAVSRPG